MTTLIHSDAVAYYAAQVRAALDGLDQETVNELTDGLEADLSEAVLDEVDLAAGESPSAVLASLEADGLVQRFGPPSEYARELAAAADVVIPASVESDRVSKVQAIRDLGSDVRVWWDGFLQRHRWLSELGGLVASLRPVWWLARGWGLYFFIVEGWFSWEYVPRTAPGWAFLGVAVLASIQFGRGKLWRSRWWRILGIGASVIAVCGLISGLWGFPDWVRSLGSGNLDAAVDAAYWDGMSTRFDGVYINGSPATNLFVYDADGQPVEGARIVDQDGRWVVLANPDGTRWNYVEPDYLTWSDGVAPDFVVEKGVAPNAYPYTYLQFDVGATSSYVDGQFVPGEPVAVAEPAWPQDSLAPLGSGDAAEGDGAAGPGEEVAEDAGEIVVPGSGIVEDVG